MEVKLRTLLRRGEENNNFKKGIARPRMREDERFYVTTDRFWRISDPWRMQRSFKDLTGTEYAVAKPCGIGPLQKGIFRSEIPLHGSTGVMSSVMQVFSLPEYIHNYGDSAEHSHQVRTALHIPYLRCGNAPQQYIFTYFFWSQNFH